MTSPGLGAAGCRPGSAVVRAVNRRLVGRKRWTGRAGTGRPDPVGDVNDDWRYVWTPAGHVVDDATVRVAYLLLDEVARADTGQQQSTRKEEGSSAIAATLCCSVPSRVGSCREPVTLTR